MASTVEFAIVQAGVPAVERRFAKPGTQLIDAGECVVFIEGPPGSSVRCDGADVPTLAGPDRVRAQCMLRDDRLLGVRRVEVVTSHGLYRLDVYLKGARAALDDLGAAVDLVLHSLPRHRGPFWYLDSFGTRRIWVNHARAVAFAIDNVDSIERTIRAIDAAPRRDSIQLGRRSALAAHVDIAATRDLVSRHPELVSRERAGVPREIGRVVPAQVIALRRTRTLDTVDHRRLAAFVAALHRDLEVAGRSGALDAKTAAASEMVAHRLSGLVATTFLDGLQPRADVLANRESTQAEMADARYGELRRLREHYLSEVQPALALDPYGRQFLPRPDEVYQAFCVHMVAAALDMEQVQNSAPGGPAYVSDDFDLYYNVVGPLEGWRHDTDRPDAYRPDIVLCRRSDPGRVAVLDAKYAVSSDGRLPGERRRELDAYMGVYGLTRIGALFPGPADDLRPGSPGHEVSGYGRTIIEIPLRGRSGESLDVVLHRLRSAMAALETRQQLGVAESP